MIFTLLCGGGVLSRTRVQWFGKTGKFLQIAAIFLRRLFTGAQFLLQSSDGGFLLLVAFLQPDTSTMWKAH